MTVEGHRTTGDDRRPDASYTLFYYADVAAAVEWYDAVLGLEKVRTIGSGAVFRLTPTSYLALIDQEHGSQRAIPGTNKGVVLSIETDDLEARLGSLMQRGAVGRDQAISIGAGGFAEEFKIHDPELYTIEFFRWRTPG